MSCYQRVKRIARTQYGATVTELRLNRLLRLAITMIQMRKQPMEASVSIGPGIMKLKIARKVLLTEKSVDKNLRLCRL